MLKASGGFATVPNSMDCSEAVQMIQAMDAQFRSAPPSIQASFQSAHDDIMSQFNDVYSWYVCDLPFGVGGGSTLEAIATDQAQPLLQNMQRAMGQNPSPGVSSASNWTTIIAVIGIGYLALVYLAGHQHA